MSPPLGPPPAPPPPPPSVLASPPVLQSSRRPPSYSNREIHNSVPSPPKPPAPGLDPETLQHAAAGLRKTQHSRSLLGDQSDISHGRLDRKDVRLPGRNWPNSTFNETLESYKTRETVSILSVTVKLIDFK
uniref:WH2 domain-containing protein n=1 Tax=Syphacia muris TaxID=451379 RepID=A0A0N5AUS2_9BILA